MKELKWRILLTCRGITKNTLAFGVIAVSLRIFKVFSKEKIIYP